jgi:hypothetical protein
LGITEKTEDLSIDLIKEGGTAGNNQEAYVCKSPALPAEQDRAATRGTHKTVTY